MAEVSERLALMRRSTSGMETVATKTTGGLLVPYSDTRVTLLIMPPVSDAVWVRLRTTGTGQQGRRLASGSQPLELNVWDHGDMVRGPWFATMETGDREVTYFDTHLPLSS